LGEESEGGDLLGPNFKVIHVRHDISLPFVGGACLSYCGKLWLAMFERSLKAPPAR